MRWGYIVRGAFFLFPAPEANCAAFYPLSPLPHASRFRTRIDDVSRASRLSAQTRSLSTHQGNIGVATRHNAADPDLAALSFPHASAETLLQEAKRFYVVCSMEVVEHVDNPGAFLRSCVKLVKGSRYVLFCCCSLDRRVFVPFSCLRFPFFLFVAFNLADAFSSRRSHGHRSLISLRPRQPRRCFASSSLEHTPFLLSKIVNPAKFVGFFAIPLTGSSQP